MPYLGYVRTKRASNPGPLYQGIHVKQLKTSICKGLQNFKHKLRMQKPKTTSYFCRIFYMEDNQFRPGIELRNYMATIYLFSRSGFIPLSALPILNSLEFNKYIK